MKLLKYALIIFSLAMLLYYGIKDEIEAVEGLREYLKGKEYYECKK